MTDNELKIRIQELLNKGKPAEALELIFNNYRQEHPEARNLPLYQDKVTYKVKTEFSGKSANDLRDAKLLVYAFMTVIGKSAGETAFNLVLLLLHLLHKGHADPISEAIELIKLDKASTNLNIAS